MDATTYQDGAIAQQGARTGQRAAALAPRWQPDRAAYAQDHLFVVLEDGPLARQCATALVRAGVAAESGIHVYAGPHDAARLEGEERRHLLPRLFRTLQEVVTYDEQTTRKRYPQALRQGKAVLMVACPTDTEVQRAADILAGAGARQMVYYGRWNLQLIDARQTVTTGEPR